MGIYLPFGIALFHASNSRFLHVAKMQKKFIQNGKGSTSDSSSRSRSKGGGLVGRFFRIEYTARILLVSSGMLFQLLLTIFMYLISRKWHRSFGIPGTEVGGTEMEQKMQMGRGWEWWPFVLW